MSDVFDDGGDALEGEVPPAQGDTDDAFDLGEEAEDTDPVEPDENADENPIVTEDADNADTVNFSELVMEAHQTVSQQLAQMTSQFDGSAMGVDSLEGAGNIMGVGLGASEDTDFLNSEPGAGALNIYVAEACSADDARAALVDGMGVSAASTDDMPVNVIVSGQIDADSHRFRIRPAPGGVSCGHFRVTAGTLGCLARGRRAPRNRRILVLSNNHVLADSNRGRFGDSILQPGRADGGRNPADRIAILERFRTIRFGGPVNYVDCATGWAWPDRVRKEMIYRSSSGLRLFRISSQIRSCQRNMVVGKTGRTTQLRVGRVTDCAATVRVNYGGGRVALFQRQIVIRGINQPFSAGGDSGSVIWTWDGRRNPVGLLYAGSSTITIANHMSHVVSALDINLHT